MKKIIILFTSIIILLLNCDVIEGPKKIVNPYNPSDDDFIAPIAIFSACPDNESTVDNCDINFQWSGNAESMNFRFKLDDNIWSEWSSEQSIEYTLLDEGLHRFQIESRYFNQVTSDQSQIINFTVDDIQGQALVFFPRKVEVSGNENFSVEIIGHELSNVSGLNLDIDFNYVGLQVQSIEIFDQTTELLKCNNGSVIPFHKFDNQTGTINIDIGIATGTPAGISGTGRLARINFTNITQTNKTISFNSTTELRDPANQKITLTEMVNSQVVIR